VIRVVGVTQDITDLKRSQQESAAKQKLESVGTLASGIAHDFNNLLGGVLAQADLALAEHHAGMSPEPELKAIREVAIRGSEIVRQLMIYTGQDREVLGQADVSRVIEEMLELLRISVSKHATLQTVLDPDLPSVRASGAQVRQIIMNLAINASEAIGDREGVIRVTTRCVPGQDIAFTGSANGDYVQIEISDNGCGIPAEKQARLFDPFFTTKSAGRGLGLAVVDGIVRGLQGTIQVLSAPGQGATFQVLLPAAERTAMVTSEPASDIVKSAGTSQKFTVLVVEDEDTLRQAVVRMLRRSGFEVLEAEDGTVAIELVRAEGTNIDLILLDMTIPGASSQEVAVVANRVRPHVKLVLTSAYGEDILRTMPAAVQALSFIRKPFQLRVLVETLQSALARGIANKAVRQASH
jgi:nitrogen-specific signal transduction histidine kinase/ActR/RegA family two-component response regulator